MSPSTTLGDRLQLRAMARAGNFASTGNLYPSWFFALLTSERQSGSISYQAVSHAYPEPLLVSASRTLESTQDVGPNPTQVSLLSHRRVAPPWRLVAASDGLLERLGAGNQRKGRQTLLRWQTGSVRDGSPASYLGTDTAPDDDEALMVVAWDGWDETLELMVNDDARRHRVVHLVRDRVKNVLGNRQATAVDEALVEALDNVRKHAYGGDGPVTVRIRQEGQQCRVEVVDQGRGTAVTETGGLKVIRHWTETLDIRRAYPSGTVVSFTVGVPDSGEEHGTQ